MDSRRERFAPEVETAAYRVVQEALTNVARHANVPEATVRVWTHQETLSIEVADAGEGFDVDAAVSDARRVVWPECANGPRLPVAS